MWYPCYPSNLSQHSVAGLFLCYQRRPVGFPPRGSLSFLYTYLSPTQCFSLYSFLRSNVFMGIIFLEKVLICRFSSVCIFRFWTWVRFMNLCQFRSSVSSWINLVESCEIMSNTLWGRIKYLFCISMAALGESIFGSISELGAGSDVIIGLGWNFVSFPNKTLEVSRETWKRRARLVLSKGLIINLVPKFLKGLIWSSSS